MGYIFISYSHKDSEYVRKLEDVLIQRGFEVWIDERIDYGTRWPKVIQDHLDACDAFIVVVSENSYESEWVQHEVTRAQRKRKRIFPLLLSGDTWLSIESTQYVDVRGGRLPPESFYARLSNIGLHHKKVYDSNQDLSNVSELPFPSHKPVVSQTATPESEGQSKQRLFELVSHPLFIGIFFFFFAIFIQFYIFPKYSVFIATDIQLIQSFIEWFGAAYSLLIAFVLVNAWTQHDSVQRDFDKEADVVLMFYQLTKQIKESSKTKTVKSRITDYIKAYVRHIIVNFKQEHKNSKIRDSGDRILETVRNFLGELIQTDEQNAITTELIRELNDIIDYRGDRISQSKQSIPKQVWRISLLTSALWVTPFYALNFRNDWVAIFLVGGVTAVVTSILAIIKELDNPFKGIWKISIDTWELLEEKLE